MIGRKLSNFQINERLGEGGMGTVYRATDLTLNRAVAIKMLHPFLVNNPDSFKRFQNEAHLSARISHPNVATLFNFQNHENNHFIVMEYVKGKGLDDVLKLQGKLSESETVKIAIQVLEGLGAAHELGIMHRDLKPGNIMITQRGFVKLMDFGIARLEHAERMTRQNSVIGTLEYLSPELVKGGVPSQASDLYALGVMLHEMLTGQTVFDASSEASLMYQIAHKQPSFQLGGVDRRLAQIIKKLTHKQPTKRYKDTQEVIRELEKVHPAGKVNPLLISQKVSSEKVGSIPAFNLSSVLDKFSLPALGNIKLPFDLDLRILAGAAVFCLFILLLGINRGSDDPSSQETDQEGAAAELNEELSTFSSNEGLQPSQVLPSEQPKTIEFIEKFPTVQPTENPKRNEPTNRESRSTERKQSTEKVEKRSPDRKTETQLKSTKPTEESAELIKNQQVEKKETKSTVRGDESSSTLIEEEPAAPKPEKKPSGSVRLRIPDTFLSAQLSQQLSSDNNREGQTVFLNTVSPVYQGGHLVIQKGARVRAVVKKVRKSDGRKKAFLAFELQAVQAVGGQWLTVSYPEYSNLSRTEVVFNKGLQLNKIKLKSTTITLNY
ncbi:MAG: protein kinase [Bacteroidota bacterium]